MSPAVQVPKKRIDVLLVERQLAPSRERAQALIMANHVLVDDVPATKPGQQVALDAAIRLRGRDHPYVSRGGVKLAAALDAFQVPAEGRVALDVGASTGGFTQVLLLRGATRVHAVDVGRSQMSPAVARDPRVLVKDGVNARHLEYSAINEKVGLITIDVSFISLDRILPAMLQFADSRTDWITLIKPQFEVGREHVGKGGIVTSEAARQEAIERLLRFSETIGLERLGLLESPITGTDGNIEFFAHWRVE